jgi:hypothetical protein
MLSFILLCAGLAACGGSGSSDTAAQTGSVSILLGDGPLDEVDQVNIDIGRVLLIGSDDGQVLLTEDAMPNPEPVNLLDLRNVTKLLLNEDGIPAGNYTKIRLYINSLEIVENESLPNPGVELAQLPANGKIDLLAQGGFEISPGEDLVVEIDMDLDRSVHVVETGNSRYRFRPVVFIEVTDLRLTQLFGTATDVVSNDAFNLCVGDRCVCTEEENDCIEVDATQARKFPAAGEATFELMENQEVHVFGLFNVGLTSDQGAVFEAVAVVQGGVDTVARIDGDLLLGTDGTIATIGSLDTTPVENALVLDRQGNLIDPADGDHAESWAQVDPMAMDLPNPFPSFLTLVTPATDEDSIEGALVSLEGDTLTLETDELEQVCVIVDDETLVQNLDDFDTDATTGPMPVPDLLALDLQMESVEVTAYGAFESGTTPACLIADVIVVER